MDLWTIVYDRNWDIYFCKLDKAIKSRILKKIQQLKQDISARHLYQINFFILEVNQYRVAFFENKLTKTRTIVFIGNHTQYEEWYKKYI